MGRAGAEGGTQERKSGMKGRASPRSGESRLIRASKPSSPQRSSANGRPAARSPRSRKPSSCYRRTAAGSWRARSASTWTGACGAAATGSSWPRGCRKSWRCSALELPAKQKRGGRLKRAAHAVRSDPGLEVVCDLSDLEPIFLEPVFEKVAVEWTGLVDRQHYLGYSAPIGQYMRRFVSG